MVTIQHYIRLLSLFLFWLLRATSIASCFHLTFLFVGFFFFVFLYFLIHEDYPGSYIYCLNSSLSHFFKELLSFMYLFIYIKLFLVMLGLCCCTWAFSSCSEQRLLSSFCAWASHCNGFSCCRNCALERAGFRSCTGA